MGFDELFHYLRLGGITMGVILAASLIALVVAIERAIALWGLSERSRALGETIAKHLLRGDVAAARSAAERADVPTADIYRAAFDRLERSRASTGALEAAVERERAQVGLRLRRYLWILGTIGRRRPSSAFSERWPASCARSATWASTSARAVRAIPRW